MKVCKILNSVVLSVSILANPVSAFAETWDSMNNPKGFFSDWHQSMYSTGLNQLPLKGEVAEENTPWADSYWPKNRGAFSYRWFDFQQNYSKSEKGQHLTAADRQRLFFNYRLHSAQEIIRMKRDQLARLSPLEKYSIVIGDFDYKLVKKFRDRNSASDEYWEGYCHAWSAASANYIEPIPVDVDVLVEGKKVTVPFGSGDVKALLTANYAELDGWSNFSGKWNSIKRVFNRNAAPKINIRFVGNICKNSFFFPTTKVLKGTNTKVMTDYSDLEQTAKLLGKEFVEDQDLEATVELYRNDVSEVLGGISSDQLTEDQREHVLLANTVDLATKTRQGADDPSCKDTNAGAFHIVMTNEIGLNRETFLMDKTRDAEIWNQPVHRYESKIIRDLPKEAYEPEQIRNAAPGTVRMVEVDTKLYYADDTDYGWTFWNPTLSGIFGLKDYFSKFLEEYKQYQAMLIKEGDQDVEEEYPAHVFDSAHYRYLLELDRKNNIIGGQWITLERPDDLYLVKIADFGGDFKGLGRIYRPLKENKRFEMRKDGSLRVILR